MVAEIQTVEGLVRLKVERYLVNLMSANTHVNDDTAEH